MLAAHIVAGNAGPHRDAIKQLVANVDELRQQDMRRKAVEAAVATVRTLIGKMPAERALELVTSTPSAAASVPETVRETVRKSLASLATSVDEERVRAVPRTRDLGNRCQRLPSKLRGSEC